MRKKVRSRQVRTPGLGHDSKDDTPYGRALRAAEIRESNRAAAKMMGASNAHHSLVTPQYTIDRSGHDVEAPVDGKVDERGASRVCTEGGADGDGVAGRGIDVNAKAFHERGVGNPLSKETNNRNTLPEAHRKALDRARGSESDTLPAGVDAVDHHPSGIGDETVRRSCLRGGVQGHRHDG